MICSDREEYADFINEANMSDGVQALISEINKQYEELMSERNKDTKKSGEEGVYAYKTEGGTYSNYLIVDLNEGYVYSFSEGNGNDICGRVEIVSGDLNSSLIVTYHDGEDIWQEEIHFKNENQSDHLVHKDSDGFETDFYLTDLIDALDIKDKKTIHDYSQ